MIADAFDNQRPERPAEQAGLEAQLFFVALADAVIAALHLVGAHGIRAPIVGEVAELDELGERLEVNEIVVVRHEAGDRFGVGRLSLHHSEPGMFGDFDTRQFGYIDLAPAFVGRRIQHPMKLERFGNRGSASGRFIQTAVMLVGPARTAIRADRRDFDAVSPLQRRSAKE